MVTFRFIFCRSVLQNYPITTYFQRSLCHLVLEMERSNLSSPLSVSMQTVYPVVLCQFTQVLLDSAYYLIEGGVLDCDAQVVCVYEVPLRIG